MRSSTLFGVAQSKFFIGFGFWLWNDSDSSIDLFMSWIKCTNYYNVFYVPRTPFCIWLRYAVGSTELIWCLNRQSGLCHSCVNPTGISFGSWCLSRRPASQLTFPVGVPANTHILSRCYFLECGQVLSMCEAAGSRVSPAVFEQLFTQVLKVWEARIDV